ncbi:MAG: glycine/betaine/sarcosine/D-proline family reductase selenoprotein B, partial [Lachnospiraceae bacterium]
MKKIVMYVNQFFGQIGGEDKADYAPEIQNRLVGPATQMNELLDGEVTHTIICGDNFMGSNTDQAIETILKGLQGIEMDLFVAGPAFQAGRYGVACGQICKAVKKEFKVPVVTSMHVENPGVEMFKKDIYILEGGNSAAKMRKDLKALANLANKILQGSVMKGAAQEGYFPRGIRHQVWPEGIKPAADRVVDMFLKKIEGKEYTTELPIPRMDRVPIAAPISNLQSAKIALITTGGIVPVDNPDKIQSASATRWGRYDISHTDDLKAGVYKTIHAGFDPSAADADPDVITPIDALREYESQGKFAKLHDYFYSTVGTGTTQAEAERMASEMVPYLKEDQV